MKDLYLENISRIYLDIDSLLVPNKDEFLLFLKELSKQTELYVALPYIIRLRDSLLLEQYSVILQNELFGGVLIRNLEELEWLSSIDYYKFIVSDSCLYHWNNVSVDFFSKKVSELYLSTELNIHELKTLSINKNKSGIVVYGRIPLMITANCINKTTDKCQNQTDKTSYSYIKDRLSKSFPVLANCHHCYNIIYNTVPLSLHNQLKKLDFVDYLRLDFCNESVQEINSVIHFYSQLLNGEKGTPVPYKDYTTGHYKRGVE